MKTEKEINELLELLDLHYKIDKCFLNYETAWQLLTATILSAQCTDERVNKITEKLFKRYALLEELAGAEIEQLEAHIRSAGFYHSKAKNIIAAANMLIDKYNGKMPSDIEELTKLPGVGRKTANVIRSHIFKLPSIVVDTHVKRISNKIGLTKNADPVKIEFDLMQILPQEHWIRFNQQIIAHGRNICKARKPDCTSCFLSPYCDAYNR